MKLVLSRLTHPEGAVGSKNTVQSPGTNSISRDCRINLYKFYDGRGIRTSFEAFFEFLVAHDPSDSMYGVGFMIRLPPRGWSMFGGRPCVVHFFVNSQWCVRLIWSTFQETVGWAQPETGSWTICSPDTMALLSPWTIRPQLVVCIPQFYYG